MPAMSRSGAAGHLIDHHPATAIDRNWTALAVQRLEGVIDRMLGVPDGASVATMRFLSHRLGIAAGPSTGTNVFGALRLACEMCTD